MQPVWKWRNAFFLTLVIGVAWLWVSRVPAGAALDRGLPAAPALGHPAPDLVVATPGGGSVRLSDLRGRPVLVNFWASWCGPCRSEMPAMQRLYERWQPEGFTILAVNQGEPEATAVAFAQSLGLTFPLALDTDYAVSDLYAVRSLPTSFFIDREGVIRSIVIGAMNGPLLESNLRKALP